MEDSPSSDSGQTYTCSTCSATFSRAHNLKSHLLTHTQERPFTCPTCSSKFRRLHDLKRHMKLHSGEKPFICGHCGRRFARQDALNRHNKTKEAGKPGCVSLGKQVLTPSYDLKLPPIIPKPIAILPLPSNSSPPSSTRPISQSQSSINSPQIPPLSTNRSTTSTNGNSNTPDYLPLIRVLETRIISLEQRLLAAENRVGYLESQLHS